MRAVPDAALVVFAALALSMLALFPFRRGLARLAVMAEVRLRWFPRGWFVLVHLIEGSDRAALEDALASIEEHIVHYPPGAGLARADAKLAARAVRLFVGSDMDSAAVVFMPGFRYEVVEFGGADAGTDEGDALLDAQAARLAALAGPLKEQMRLYI